MAKPDNDIDTQQIEKEFTKLDKKIADDISEETQNILSDISRKKDSKKNDKKSVQDKNIKNYFIGAEDIYCRIKTGFFKNFKIPDAVIPGQILLIQEEKDKPTYLPGNNISVNKSYTHFYSNTKGIVTLSGKYLTVIPVKHLTEKTTSKNKILNYNTGLVISGRIPDGTTINAGSDVFVEETISDVSIFSKGDIFLLNGISGSGKNKIFAEGSIFVKTAKNSILVSGNNIFAENLIDNRITAKNSIELTGNDQIIAGGSITAGKTITCKTAGTPNEKETIITINSTSSIKPCISASEKIYPGVKININGAGYEIDEVINMRSLAYNETKKEITVKKLEIQRLNPEDFYYKSFAPEVTFVNLKEIRQSIALTGDKTETMLQLASEYLQVARDNLTFITYARKENGKHKVLFVEVKNGESRELVSRKIMPHIKMECIIVMDETIEKCIEKASKILKIDNSSLSYKILQKPKTGVLQIGKKKIYIIEVYKSEKKKKEKESILSIDGSFTIKNSDDGLLVKITPAIGKGKPVNKSNIINHLKTINYQESINEEVLNNEIKDPSSEYKVIGPKHKQIEIYDNDKSIEKEDITLEKTVESKPHKFTKKADNIEYITGLDSYQNYDTQFFNRLQKIETAVQGQLLLSQKKDGEYLPGKNVITDESGAHFFSKIKGLPYIAGKYIFVKPVEIVEIDPDSEQKDFQYNTAVIFSGYIPDGIKIGAKGDIFIKETIGDIDIYGDGDIYLLNGISSLEGKNNIIASGTIFASSSENSNLKAGKDIIIGATITGSKIIAGGSIEMTGEKQIIADSEVKCGRTLNCKTLGSTDRKRTILMFTSKNINKCRLSVENKIYPGVIIKFNSEEEKIKKPVDNISYIYDKDKIKKNKFERSVFEYDIALIKPGENIEQSDVNMIRRSVKLKGQDTDKLLIKASDLLKINQEDLIFFTYKRDEEDLKHIIFFEIKPGETKETASRKCLKYIKLERTVVMGDTIDSCLDKASSLLHLDKEHMAYKIIQEPKSGIFGIGEKKYYILEAYKAKKLLPSKKKEITEDGQFEIKNSLTDGLLLKIKPAKGTGKPVTEEAIYKYLENKNYINSIIKTTITAETKSPSDSFVNIGPRQKEIGLDGSYEINIIEDDFKAELKIVPPKKGGTFPSLELIEQEIKKQHIVDYDLGEVEKFCKEENTGKPFKNFVIALGEKPEDPTETTLELKFQADRTEHISDDKIDYHTLSTIVNVVKDQMLAEIIKGNPGRKGRNVFGKDILPKSLPEVSIKPGKNIRVSEDGLKFYSESDGWCIYDGSTLKVENVYMINGDVDYNTGNIQSLATVVIKGAIKDGFTVESKGDIFADSIESASVSSEGNITVTTGVLGKGEALIKCKGNFEAKFVEQANIEAEGDVIVHETIMHSNVLSGRSVIVLKGKKGSIVGGSISALNSIAAKSIGSKLATETSLSVGRNPFIQREFKSYLDKYEELKKEYKNLKKNLQILKKEKSETGKLPENKKKIFLRLVEKYKDIEPKIQQTAKSMNMLYHKMIKTVEAYVLVKEKIRTNVHIQIGKFPYKNTNDLSYCTFYLDKSDIHFREYDETLIKNFL